MIKKDNKDEVKIFWTGGWDSTFRLLQLCEDDICVQPIYIIDDRRRGSKEELHAMEKILSQIKMSNKFKATIKDILFFDKDKILEEYKNIEISEAYKELKEKYSLGIQYEWFALLANALNYKIECGVEMSERSKAHNAINAEGILVPCKNDILENRLCVDTENSSRELNLVLGNLIFGIISFTKKEAEQISMKKGWMDIMELTWFCHSPIKGKPCGMCSPCKDAMNEEMEWRMPAISQWRYRYLNNIIGKVYRYILNRF